MWFNFKPQKGKEIQKVWLAVTLSSGKYNLKSNIALFTLITIVNQLQIRHIQNEVRRSERR